LADSFWLGRLTPRQLWKMDRGEAGSPRVEPDGEQIYKKEES